MSETSRLSPMTSYYLRKFIEGRQEILHERIPNSQGEITLDQLLSRMCRDSLNDDAQINIIESLVEIHKTVTRTAAPTSVIQNVDQQLLASLGVAENITQSNTAESSITVTRDCLEKLNALRHQALFLLGDTIGTKYLLETQPNDPWCQKFTITSKTQITYQGKLNERLEPQQITDFQTWIDNFSKRCGHVLTTFVDSSSDDEALFDNLL